MMGTQGFEPSFRQQCREKLVKIADCEDIFANGTTQGCWCTEAADGTFCKYIKDFVFVKNTETQMSLPTHVRYAFIVVLVMVIIILMSKWTGRSSQPSVDITIIVQEAAAANGAAHAHNNPVDALAELNCARSKLETAVSLSSADVVSRIAGVDVETLRAEMHAHDQMLRSQMQERPIVDDVPLAPLPSL